MLERRQDLERLGTYYFESLGVEESRKDAGNPLNVWRAYLECRAHKLPIPDWVLSYLDRVARRFWNLSLADSPFIRADAPGQDGSPDPATAIVEALEMKRSGRSGAGNRSGWEDRKGCEQARASEERTRPPGSVKLVCLPDTVDPRGAKGK